MSGARGKGAIQRGILSPQATSARPSGPQVQTSQDIGRGTGMTAKRIWLRQDVLDRLREVDWRSEEEASIGRTISEPVMIERAVLMGIRHRKELLMSPSGKSTERVRPW